MALINLQTNLKSLKYGNDTLGGGDSNQPYIKAPIPDSFNDLQNSNNDYILRGGPFAIQDSIIDVERLGKMFTDTKSTSGVFFVAKQNLLSRIAVRTQTSTGPLNEGAYTPLSTLAEAGVVSIGGHVLKQGLNPFELTGVGSNNPNLYGVKIENYNLEWLNSPDGALNNRLYALYESKIQGSSIGGFNKTNNVTIPEDTINLISYSGGPGSNLGIGNTNIRFATGQRTNTYNPSSLNTTNVFTYTSNQLENNGVETTVTENYTRPSAPSIQDFRKKIRISLQSTKSGATPLTPDYNTKNIEARVNIGGTSKLGPGNSTNKNLISYTSGSDIGPVDLINALNLYSSTAVTTKDIVNDLVQFRIASIHNDDPNTKTFMHFRAFIDSFSDSYNGNWNQVNYLGRGESFYTYNNFTRTISLSWTVAAQSKEELIPMYKKLNYLASNLAPDYTGNGYMTGNLVQLTIGGYLYEQVGFITSLTYDIPMESPWEIGINDEGNNDPTVKEMPHILKVTGFSFTPIHNFIPSKQTIGPTYNDNASLIDDNTYGDQRFIALANGINDNNSNYNYKSTGNTSQLNSLNK